LLIGGIKWGNRLEKDGAAVPLHSRIYVDAITLRDTRYFLSVYPAVRDPVLLMKGPEKRRPLLW
jgi:hypothetical protein